MTSLEKYFHSSYSMSDTSLLELHLFYVFSRETKISLSLIVSAILVSLALS